jgi:tripartite ATP-independent transporter DctM subunit
MGGLAIGAVLLAILLLLLSSGMWVAVTLSLVGWCGVMLFTDRPAGPNLFTSVWGSVASWELAALPMFIWMGEILFRTRLSEQMFEGLAPWVEKIPGRLMHVNVLGCGIFGSVSGSSAATCATISKVALPELLRRGYDEKVALGSLATAGTLGLLIPPSIVMVVYAVAADTSIIRVFLAGFVPGILLMALMSGYIVVWALMNPQRTPPAGPSMAFVERLWRARHLIPCVLLILFILWALVAGVATATECAAYGVLGALAIAWQSRSLNWANFSASLMGAMRVSCMITFILAGAAFLTMALAYTGVPRDLALWVESLGLSPYALILALTAVYVVLGTALDGVSMIVLTSAIVIPLVQKAGFDLVWFGVFLVLLVEIAQVTPPVGFNLFVLQNMTGRDIHLIARATVPFFFCILLCIAIVTVFPGLVTWLPNLVMGPPR